MLTIFSVFIIRSHLFILLSEPCFLFKSIFDFYNNDGAEAVDAPHKE